MAHPRITEAEWQCLLATETKRIGGLNTAQTLCGGQGIKYSMLNWELRNVQKFVVVTDKNIDIKLIQRAPWHDL
jgi:hypothetical protein